MRIGILFHSSCGGSSRIGGELAVELAGRGHVVHMFARDPYFLAAAAEEEIRFHRTAIDWGRPDPSILRLNWSEEELKSLLNCVLRVVTEEDLEILHIHYAVPFAFIAQELKARLGEQAPVLVATLHGTDVTVHGRDPVTGPSLSRMLRFFDGLTTVSYSHARVAAQVFRLKRLPTVIPNFTRFTGLHSLSNMHGSESSFPQGGGNGNLDVKPAICHVSNFRPLKDPESVARIFLGIRRRTDSELWLVGDGPEMKKVKSFVVREGIESDVRYFGLQPNVRPILACADLLLMTSITESFCLAALEAMACGVPVLATKVGGLPEVVLHGETGFLFPLGEHSSAVEFAVDLFANPVKHRAMRKAAAIRARKFSHKEIVQLYENYYQALNCVRREVGTAESTAVSPVPY